MRTYRHLSVLHTNKGAGQEQFARVAPWLGMGLLIGAAGGFMLASLLTLTRLLNIVPGPWWTALAQAHGHLQLYGWAGLFVLGVAFHFLPRLRGAPLVAPWLLPWILSAQGSALVLRAFAQPYLVLGGAALWRWLFIASGILECVALLSAVGLFALTARRGPPLKTRVAFLGILPFILMAFASLAIASISNLFNVIQAASGLGLIMNTGDSLNITLGLLGFLAPIALAMSARSLPMYAGLTAFPPRMLWPLSGCYILGLALYSVGIPGELPLAQAGIIEGVGMMLVGGVFLVFIAIFMYMIRTRGKLPRKVADLAPEPHMAAHTYQIRVSRERSEYGPFVGLVASSYLWAALGALLLLGDGIGTLLGIGVLSSPDAMRHAFALGFIALLICGVAPRMLPGFSGGHIASAKYVHATLWLGNSAALLRVGSLLLTPLLSTTEIGATILTVSFGLSGPLGLALAICLALNLWPALGLSRQTQST